MLAIRDCLRAIPCDVVAVGVEMADNAGQFLLGSGTRGRAFRDVPWGRSGSTGVSGSAKRPAR